MTIYHIAWYYTKDNKVKYYVSPYNLKRTVKMYFAKIWATDTGKAKRNIFGLIKFLSKSSFSKYFLEKRCKRMNSRSLRKVKKVGE